MEQPNKCVSNLIEKGYNKDYARGWCDRNSVRENRTTSLGINHRGVTYNTNHPIYSFLITIIVIGLLLGVGYMILHLWGLI